MSHSNSTPPDTNGDHPLDEDEVLRIAEFDEDAQLGFRLDLPVIHMGAPGLFDRLPPPGSPVRVIGGAYKIAGDLAAIGLRVEHVRTPYPHRAMTPWLNQLDMMGCGEKAVLREMWLEAERRGLVYLEGSMLPAPTRHPNAPNKPRLRLFSSFDLGVLPPRQWLLKGVLARGELGVLFGPFSAFKSFVATSLAVAIADGTPWVGRKVKQGSVVIIAGEGLGGMANRLRAAMGVARMADASDVIHKRLHIATEMPPLATDAGFDLARAAIEPLSEVPVLCMVDTWARLVAAHGFDENSASDTGRVVDALHRLCARFPGMAGLAVAHPGAANGERERGSTALPGAVDARLRLERVGGISGMTAKMSFLKVKDGKEPDPILLDLAEAVVGVDEDGENETSLYLSDWRPETEADMPADEAEADLRTVLQAIAAKGPQLPKDLVPLMKCRRSAAYDRLRRWAAPDSGKLTKRGDRYGAQGGAA